MRRKLVTSARLNTAKDDLFTIEIAAKENEENGKAKPSARIRPEGSGVQKTVAG